MAGRHLVALAHDRLVHRRAETHGLEAARFGLLLRERVVWRVTVVIVDLLAREGQFVVHLSVDGERRVGEAIKNLRETRRVYYRLRDVLCLCGHTSRVCERSVWAKPYGFSHMFSAYFTKSRFPQITKRTKQTILRLTSSVLRRSRGGTELARLAREAWKCRTAESSAEQVQSHIPHAAPQLICR